MITNKDFSLSCGTQSGKIVAAAAFKAQSHLKNGGASYGYFVRTVGHNLTAGQNVGTDVEEMNLGIIAQVKPVEQKKEKK